MAHADSWPQIRHHGLLSSGRLLYETCQTPSQLASTRVERQKRSIPCFHPDFGKAVIRDQEALILRHLRLTLDTTLEEWLELLDSRVFLWASEDSLNKLMRAKNYKDSSQTVLVFNTHKLFERYQNRIEVADINTGSTIFPNSPVRGRGTFQRIHSYQKVGRRTIVEVTVPGCIKPIEEVLEYVEHREPGKPPRLLYKSA